MSDKRTSLIRLATSLSFDLPDSIVTKEKVMNYYIHQYQDAKWDDLTVNDIIKAARMAGKRVKGNSLLEINVSLKEQLEFYSQDMRLYNGRGSRYDASRILEKNKSLVISSYLDGIPTKIIASDFFCSEYTVRRFLKEKEIFKPKFKRKRKSSKEMLFNET